MTLAEKLGRSAGHSALLERARRMGLGNASMLEALAVRRGCWHYRHDHLSEPPELSESVFSNEELAIALLSPHLPYSPHTIRLGAAMLGAAGNQPADLINLAVKEGCEAAVRYIASAAIQFEPDCPLWRALEHQFRNAGDVAEGVFPHPTRFVSMTGITRAGRGRAAVWIRPLAELAVAHG